MKQNQKTYLLGLLVWLTTIQIGWSFYNSQTGRWLSRDPIQESGGPNLYEFVMNRPLQRTDSTGNTWKWQAKDLGQRPPITSPSRPGWHQTGNTKVVKWEVEGSVKPCQGQCCSFKAHADGDAAVEYWWSDLSALAHELRHVGIWDRAWSDTEFDIFNYELSCVSREKATCYAKRLFIAIRNFYVAKGSLENAEFDDSEYPHGGDVEGALLVFYFYQNQLALTKAQCAAIP